MKPAFRRDRHTLATTLALAATLALTGTAGAATQLQYEVEGACATDFVRMRFDGLKARIDQQIEGETDGDGLSTIFDDSEQLMYLLMHDSRSVMTMESDDDAVDFHSDVGRSVSIHARRQTESFTGMAEDALIAQARAMQIAMCPELADIGHADPDYAEAATRCAGTMQTKMQQDPQAREDLVAAMTGRSAQRDGLRSARVGTPAPTAAAPPPARTTRTERGATRTIGGIACTVETTWRGDTVLREECRAPVEALALDPAPMRRLARIVKVGQGMGAGIASLHPELDDSQEPAQVALQRRCFRAGRPTGTATLRIERDVVVAADAFEVPAGYTPFSTDAAGIDDAERGDLPPPR